MLKIEKEKSVEIKYSDRNLLSVVPAKIKTNNRKHLKSEKPANNLIYELHQRDASTLSKQLLDRFTNLIQLIYLDPPYNTKRARGSRKNYTDKSSIWSEDVLPVIKNSHHLLKEEGFLAVSINQMELFNLKNIVDSVFGSQNFIGLFPIKIRHSERQLMINATYHDVFEYLLFYRKNKKTRFFTEHKMANIDKFIYRIETNNPNPEKRTINGKLVEIYKPDDFKIIKEKGNLNNLRQYVIAGKIATANWSGEFFENNLRSLGTNLLIKVYGLENEGLGYRWFQTQNSKRNSGLYYQSSLTAGRPILPTNDLDYTDVVPNVYKEGGLGVDFKDSKKPEQLLEYILDITTKENDLVGDFYAGSGTTIATCIKKLRSCVTGDNNANSIQIVETRLNNLLNGHDICKKKYDFNIIKND